MPKEKKPESRARAFADADWRLQRENAELRRRLQECEAKLRRGFGAFDGFAVSSDADAGL